MASIIDTGDVGLVAAVVPARPSAAELESLRRLIAVTTASDRPVALARRSRR